MLITSGKSDYDVKPLKQLNFGGGGQNAYSAPSIIIFGGQLPPLPPTSRVHAVLPWSYN